MTKDVLTKTKRDFVLAISEKTKVDAKSVQEICDLFLDHMIEALGNGDRIEFRNFGTFEIVKRKEKKGRNPNKPEVEVVIPARAAVKFKAGKTMKSSAEKLTVEGLKGDNVGAAV